MKRGTKSSGKVREEGQAIKTISLPKVLLEEAEEVVSNEPEMTFSAYVRQLIRTDLAQRKKAA